MLLLLLLLLLLLFSGRSLYDIDEIYLRGLCTRCTRVQRIQGAAAQLLAVVGSGGEAAAVWPYGRIICCVMEIFRI